MTYIEFTAVGYSEEYTRFPFCGGDLAIRLSQLFKCGVNEVDSGYVVWFDRHYMLLGKDNRPHRWFLKIEQMAIFKEAVNKQTLREIVEILSTEKTISGIIIGD